MATKKAADSTLYHLSPKGFWKKFRDVTAVSPQISSGIPIAGINRYPPPGSRPEKYATPATKASDPAQNPYWKRDVRRAYPQLSVITQPELSNLLIEHAEKNIISAPSTDKETGKNSVPATATKPLDLSVAISSITSSRKVFSETALPPKFPTPFKRWSPQLAPDAPHDPNAYFPMLLYK